MLHVCTSKAQMLYFVLHITTACFISNSVGSDVYYVMPTTGNQACPTGHVCHHISYYCKKFTNYYHDITLIFQEGLHILNCSLHIVTAHYSVTLKGQGQLTHDDQWSIIPSSAIVINGGKITVFSKTTVSMERLTYKNGKLGLYAVQHALIHSFSLQNTSLIVESGNVTITDIRLDNTSCIHKWCYIKGMTLSFSSATVPVIHNIKNVTIQGVSSNVNYIGQRNIAVMNLLCDDITTKVSLEDITITNNNATGISADGCGDIAFGNFTVSNNHSPNNGGGMWIVGSRGLISSKPNTTVSFINNTAKGVGGAIYCATDTYSKFIVLLIVLIIF